ncbi:hypothetical protein Tco_0191143 [Tanacetum coccineum]
MKARKDRKSNHDLNMRSGEKVQDVIGTRWMTGLEEAIQTCKTSLMKREKSKIAREEETARKLLALEEVAVDVDCSLYKVSIVDWGRLHLYEDVAVFIQGWSKKVYSSKSRRNDLISYYADAKWDCYTYAYRKEVSFKSRNAIKDDDTNGVSTASTNLVLSELVNTARRKINTADGQSC